MTKNASNGNPLTLPASGEAVRGSGERRAVWALERCETLLDAVVRFMDENPVAAEYTVHYDEAECDGSCLGCDCEAALAEVQGALAALQSRENPREHDPSTQGYSDLDERGGSH